MWSRIVTVFIFLLVACGDDASAGVDAGTSIDASTPRDSSTLDARVGDGSTRMDAGGTVDGGETGSDGAVATDGGAPVDGGASDAGPMDGGCTPESAAAFCSRLGAACGSVSGNDNCGAARTGDCGACTAPTTCGGGSAGANMCGCSAPPDVTGLTASCASGSVRVSFSGVSTIYTYLFRVSSSGAPPPCSPGDAALVGTAGLNTFTLAGGPSLGGCGQYRLCTYEPVCDADYSPGRVINVCVDSVGMLTCTVM